MGYLFPVNPVSRTKPDSERMEPAKRVGEEEKQFGNNQNDQEDNFDQLEEKVNKLISDKKIMEAIDLSGLDPKARSKLLEIAKNAASSLLKKELIDIVKSIFTISEKENIDDDIDEEDLSFSDHLARLIMKLAMSKSTTSQNSVTKKVGKANALEDKNAGFLVHYCKDILNKKIRQQKNEFKPERLNKKDIIKYLKK